MSDADKRTLVRILVALALFLVMETVVLLGLLDFDGGLWVQFALFLVPYLIAGYDVLARAAHGIAHGQVFDENFLMSIATIGAFSLVLFPESEPHMAEGATVMLFYQVGELFQSYAVGKSRASIAELMDIAPDYANVLVDGTLEQVDPYDVSVGETIVVKPGERVPLDGVVVAGSSQLDTAALTGESVPRAVREGDEVTSGCVNLTGALHVRVDRPYESSTVQRVLELVEESSERKARTENFITRFARYYTPIVVGLALALAVLPPLLLGQAWANCVESALVFLVVSCPCALVISVPLSFFGGIGAASRNGILVKGSSYLEALGSVRTVVFDKTGTLTSGTFEVVAVHAEDGISTEQLVEYAAHAEAYSDHPIALSVKRCYGAEPDASRIDAAEERGGHGVRACVDGHDVAVGNDKLMAVVGVEGNERELSDTVLSVAIDGAYAGFLRIADAVKPDAARAVAALRRAGVRKAVMLTGDAADVAADVAAEVGVDEYRAQLLPQDKVACVEELLGELAGPGGEAGSRAGTLAFVGDGINDAPVLMRADVGIAMGALGSDAAIEAADIVLMDDDPAKIAVAISIARATMRIVWQNIVFALGVKVLIMVLALPVFSIASMWMAVFGDVGVACLAIANAMRALRAK